MSETDKRSVIYVRVSETDRRALEAVARVDDRSLSSLVRKILGDWLAAQHASARAGTDEYPDYGPTDPWETSGPNAP